MITYEAVESNLKMARNVTLPLLSDLSDEDLMARPVPDANHIAWQLGHLVTSEYWIISQAADQVEMAFPADWQEKYSKEAAKSDDQTHFETKERYLEALNAQRQATLDVLKTLPSEQLTEPGPEPLRMIVQTVGELFLFQAHHELMHAGQFTCIRRKLGKPVLF
ncbi:MAG: DinB family protein [Phycisphaerales bacterium]|nr:DinB family protein [Phycisphaerales bacterium]